MSTTITASNPRPSTCSDRADAIDLDVSVTLPDGETIDGEVTLLPAEDGSGYSSSNWGSADHWVSGELLSAIVGRDDASDILYELASVAGAVADRYETDDEDEVGCAVIRSEDMSDGVERDGAKRLFTGTRAECEAYARDHADDYHYGLEVVE